MKTDLNHNDYVIITNSVISNREKKKKIKTLVMFSIIKRMGIKSKVCNIKTKKFQIQEQVY